MGSEVGFNDEVWEEEEDLLERLDLNQKEKNLRKDPQVRAVLERWKEAIRRKLPM